MVQKMFAWLAGLGLVLIFLVIISPDLFRGYVFSADLRSPGKKTYDVYCVGCHGEEGLGNGPAAEFLNPKPRNFVNGDYKFFHFGEPGPLPSDESLKITVRNGLAGASMPAFPLLTDQEIVDVTTYVKSLREGGWEEQDPIQAAPEPVAIEGTTGEELFIAAACNSCHQHDGLGSVGGVGPNLTDVGNRLVQDEIVQSIVEPNAVIAENCPAGPCPAGVMPQNLAERLKPEQIEALAMFLAESK
jgi:mono/diheme cytochrome c family protein